MKSLTQQSFVLEPRQIEKLKDAYQLTETEIRTYVALNKKYRKNAQAVLHKFLIA